ncbi:hypothetical protein CRYUN_Cryun33cG0089900 [Craigia yunnanensis]
MFGRLGNDLESDELFPVRVKFQNSALKFIAVAAGSYHILALAAFILEAATVLLSILFAYCIFVFWYILDCHMDGQLGLNGENYLAPQLLEQFLELGSTDQDELEIKSKAPLKICAVKARGMTSLAIYNLGGLWMWGNCPQENSSGDGGLTFLGLGDRESRVHSEIVETFNQDSQWTAYEVAYGAFHTALLTHKKRPSDTIETGDVWSWGMKKGLGLCPDACFTGTDSGDAISPPQISGHGVHGHKFHDPVQGRSEALGNGKTIDCFSPSIVLWPPLSEDFKQEELNNTIGEEDKIVDDKGSDGVSEMNKKLSLAMEEMKLLQSKLSIMEQYASILHDAIFGKPLEEKDIPLSLQDLGTSDIAREWENMLESADRSKL